MIYENIIITLKSSSTYVWHSSFFRSWLLLDSQSRKRLEAGHVQGWTWPWRQMLPGPCVRANFACTHHTKQLFAYAMHIINLLNKHLLLSHKHTRTTRLLKFALAKQVPRPAMFSSHDHPQQSHQVSKCQSGSRFHTALNCHSYSQEPQSSCTSAFNVRRNVQLAVDVFDVDSPADGEKYSRRQLVLSLRLTPHVSPPGTEEWILGCMMQSFPQVKHHPRLHEMTCTKATTKVV